MPPVSPASSGPRCPCPRRSGGAERSSSSSWSWRRGPRPPPGTRRPTGSARFNERRTAMRGMGRREFLRTSGVGLGIGLLGGGCATAMKGDFAPKTSRRVVVVGGGWGGATAAKYVRLGDPAIEVILLEPNRQFVSCPFSNLVLSGVRTLDSITFDYAGLRRHGVRLIHEAASADRKSTRLNSSHERLSRMPSSA